MKIVNENKGSVIRILLLLSMNLIALSAWSQDFAITRYELAGDKLVISYNLLDTVKNRHYTVSVFSSLDNFLNPLQKVSGDAGLEIAPGPNKKIVWNAREELGAAFSGRIAVEIRGREYIPFVHLTGFDDIKVHKRGVPFTITWTGGTQRNVLNFDLYDKADTKVWTQAGVGNTGHHELTIPTSVAPGDGYHFKISDSKNKDDVVYTNDFEIKRKVPLLMKAIPVIGVGAAAYFLLGSGTKAPESIEDPLCPPGSEDCNN